MKTSLEALGVDSFFENLGEVAYEPKKKKKNRSKKISLGENLPWGTLGRPTKAENLHKETSGPQNKNKKEEKRENKRKKMVKKNILLIMMNVQVQDKINKQDR